MKRILATAAVCAALAGVLTGCSGTNYSYSGYDTRDVYRDGMGYDGYYGGMATDGYYDGRNSNTGRVNENTRDNRSSGNNNNDRNNRTKQGNDLAGHNNQTTTVPRSNTTAE